MSLLFSLKGGMRNYTGFNTAGVNAEKKKATP